MRKSIRKRFDLNGRVAIVTGGAGLLGREYASALAEAGACVVVADIAARRAAAVADAVAAQTGADVVGWGMDVTSPTSVKRTVARAQKRWGRLDILVNNAALDPKFDKAHAGRSSGDFENFPLEQWEASLRVDLTGMFLCAQAVAPAMRKQGGGVIVNVSSIYGLVGPDQRLYAKPRAPAAYKPVTYSVTKSAVLGFTRYLATYWAGKNIRVNTLTPGGVFNDHDDGFQTRYAARTPMGRMARPDELSAALLFLVSDASSYMTGANLVVDGGWSAW